MTELRNATGISRFLHRIGRLKHIPRTGWVDRGIDPRNVESVADHSFRTTLLVWFAAKEFPHLDETRLLKLALIHDLAEAITGDIPPYDPALLEQQETAPDREAFLNQRHIRNQQRRNLKRAAEAAAISELTATLPEHLKTELLDLWREAEEVSSPEAQFVKQADKMETFLQSQEYYAADPSKPMASFVAEVNEIIDIPILMQIRDAILQHSHQIFGHHGVNKK